MANITNAIYVNNGFRQNTTQYDIIVTLDDEISSTDVNLILPNNGNRYKTVQNISFIPSGSTFKILTPTTEYKGIFNASLGEINLTTGYPNGQWGVVSTKQLESVYPIPSKYSITISPEHYRLHNGEAFSVTSILSNLSAGASIYIEFIMPSDKTVDFQGFNIASDKLIRTDFYEGSNVTDGTIEIPIVNRKRDSLNVATTKIYSNPTNVSGGTLLRSLFFGNIEGQGNSVSSLPHFTNDPFGFNVKKDTKYALKLTNLSTTATTLLFFNLEIYEF